MSHRRPRDRKAIIVATAAELFAQKGYAAVGIDDVGAAVGISGPAIYRHFRGKDALLAEVVASNAARIADGVRSIDRTASPDEFVRLVVAIVLDNPSALTTAIREFRRLRDVGGFEGWASAQRQIDAAWRDVMRKLNPDLDRSGVTVRLAAMVGPTLGAIGPTPVLRPRLDELTASSILEILRSPQQPASANPPARWPVPASKRDELLSSAVWLFAERGYAGVGMNEIARRADLSRPTAYHYYESKAAMLVDAFELGVQRHAAALDLAVASGATASEVLRSMVEGFVRLVFDDLALFEVVQREVEALEPNDRARIQRRLQGIEDTWTSVLREVRSDVTMGEARLLVRMTFPLVVQAVRVARARPALYGDIAGVAVAHLTGSDK